MTRLMTVAALVPVLVVAMGGCSPSDAAPAGKRGGAVTGRTGSKMTETIKLCAIKSARLNLIGEQVLTRATVTVERADSVVPPIAIAEGDPRLARLKPVLEALRLEPSNSPSVDIRTLIRIECTDGTTRTIAAARTYDGRVDLSVDGRMMSTNSPLRREIDAIFAAA